MAVTQEYLDTLLLYYEEEIEGEAYFAALAKRFDDPQKRVKIQLLADVEKHAAAGVAPLIAKYGLKARSTAALTESGVADANNTALEWDDLLADMRETYPGYLKAFEDLEGKGPAEDKDLLSFLTEHEVAAIKFLDEEAQDPSKSRQPLQDYIETPASTWRCTTEKGRA